MAHLWAFDTEDDSKGTPFLFNFYHVDSGRHFSFTDQVEALDFACSRPRSHFWAVNLEYDILNLFRGHFGMLEYCFAGSKMIYAELKADRIRFLDTMNHWKLSVAKMGERIMLPKLEMKHGVRVSKLALDDAIAGKLKPTAKAAKMLEYCRRDTEITGRFVATMQKKYQQMGAELKTTVASSTLDLFEREYFEKSKHLFTEEQIDFFHQGYYGGRTEVFYIKPIEGKIWYHDVNSLYPYCLKVGSFPVLDTFYETVEPDWQMEGMADIRVRAPTGLKIPYLPARSGGKLVFALGSWRGVYTYFEVREAIKLGYKVEKVHRAVEFPQKFNPFARFIDDMYGRRMEARRLKDSLLADGFKDFMNHCYGKYAQKNESIKLIPIKKTKLKGGDVLFGDLVFRKEKIKYPRYANCIWAAYCTAYGRHTLYPHLVNLEAKKAMLLYCDTDSVIYESKFMVLPDSEKLGELKLERPKGDNALDHYTYAHFKLPKLYCLKSPNSKVVYKTKGVPSRVSEEFFEKGKATFQKPNKMRETFRRNLSPKRKEKIIPNFWELRQKEIIGKYTKRKVLKDGSTRPLFLRELGETNV